MFSGFHDEDFDVFSVPGLDARMDAIKTHVRPKLEVLGTHFQSYLAPRIGDEVYAHVAKHARRTVNPPNDTWVAFSTNARGYKQHQHFQIGLWQTHMFVTFGYIYEAPNKSSFGVTLEQKAALVHDMLPEQFVWIPDHTSPESIPGSDVDEPQIVQFAKRLQTVKKAELLVGARWPREQVVDWDGERFLANAEDVMEKLVPLYQLTPGSLT
ncbi:YktB family protein [Alicyclobacillus dauci]|uniref:UPF0637 protein NZD86_20625 n=1 Tax=Alicyclobacillus dauci TaxID=1475485 RepID=A0ABY6Z1G2_9BACL|nr:DUF1054 domain-containing protein [Alicyclobacillus dauci]WAH36580.1 DUF1054 domain-containing protein [Alicyclobacillus dauci]